MTDINKTEPTDSNEVSRTVVPEPFKNARMPKFTRLAKKLLILRKQSKAIIIFLLLIAILTAVGTMLYMTLRPVLKIGNYSYNSGQYNKLLAEAKRINVNEPDARKALIEGLSARAAADELKIAYPTDAKTADDAARLKYELADDDTPSEYQRVSAYRSVIAPHVRVAEFGGYKVAIVNFPFSRYLVGFAGEEFGDRSLIGNEKAIHDDLTYAKAASDKYSGLYAKKQKTLVQIISEVRADPRLVYGQASNQSRVVLVTDDATEESMYGTNQVPSDLYGRVKELSGQPGTGKLYEETFSAGARDYGVNMPELVRGEQQTLVGWYFLVVDQKVDKQAGIVDRYQKTLKGYSDGEK